MLLLVNLKCSPQLSNYLTLPFTFQYFNLYAQNNDPRIR